MKKAVLHTSAVLPLKKPFVKVGQIWKNNDPRTLFPEIRVVALIQPDETGVPTKASVVARAFKDLPWSSNIRNIRVRRFRNGPRGYTLLHHPAR